MKTISTKGFEAVVRTNLTGGFIFMREVYSRWMRENGGAIVNMIADIWNGWPNFAHSGASRGGMLTLSESAASEWAAAGVRVNTVAPGAIASSGLDTYDAEHRAYIQNEIACEIPLQRFGTEAEVAAAIVFLLVAGRRLHHRLLHPHRRRGAERAPRLGQVGRIGQEQTLQRLSSRERAGNSLVFELINSISCRLRRLGETQ